jgi:hypothetical protein
MVCSTCGLDNDPSAATCARCNTTLAPAPTAPAAATYERPAPSGNRMPLVAALVVVALLAAVAAAVLIYRRDDPQPPAAAQVVLATTAPAEPVDPPPATVDPTTVDTAAAGPDQARVVDALLDRSIRSRNKLNQAIQRVGRCTGLSGALSDMRSVGDERRAQLDEIGSADLSALPNGETLRSTWRTALQSSLDADEAYVAWAEPAVAHGCATTSSRNAAYSRGRSASTKAGAAKSAFLAEWNPVAATMGLPERSRDQI